MKYFEYIIYSLNYDCFIHKIIPPSILLKLLSQLPGSTYDLQSFSSL
jgi:hypothetical protein